MTRLLAIAITALTLPLAGCAFVLDFDEFEVGEGVDGGDAGGLDGGTADADASLPDGFVPDGCEPAEEICDQMDNDCDGDTDEAGFAPDDPAHCGACGVACADGYDCMDGFCMDEARSLAAGDGHTCVALRGGEVWCFGANMDGQVGTGSFSERESVPQRVATMTLATNVGAGGMHSCYVGSVTQCWGRNELGQLADGSSSRSATPVGTMNASDAVEVVGGEAHTCVRTRNDVRCAGSNEFGQLGQLLTVADQSRFQPTTTPLTTPADIAAGDNHTCVVLSGGGVRCFGDNSRGQLGVDPLTSESGAPVTPDLGVEATHVAAGGEHTCVITVGGGVSCWGSNSEGQLGSGAGGDTHEPQSVTLPGEGAVAIAAGGSHTCVVVNDVASEADGSVYCWGSNDDGQLGIGDDTADSATPKQVVGVAHALAFITAGESHTCVVERIPFGGGPEVRCWGLNTSGQLGIGAGLPGSTEPQSANLPPE